MRSSRSISLRRRPRSRCNRIFRTHVGYSCGAVATGSTATCASLNSTAAAGSWSPVVNTMPTGQALTINLTNNLSFTAGNRHNGVPTSLMIVGQMATELAIPNQRTTTASPDHVDQGVTWPTANTGATFTPPDATPIHVQFLRHQRVPRLNSGARPGDRRRPTRAPLRCGRARTCSNRARTHAVQETMGLYGILVVAAAPAFSHGRRRGLSGCGLQLEVPLLMVKLMQVQNNTVNAAVGTVGFSETSMWNEPSRRIQRSGGFTLLSAPRSTTLRLSSPSTA